MALGPSCADEGDDGFGGSAEGGGNTGGETTDGGGGSTLVTGGMGGVPEGGSPAGGAPAGGGVEGGGGAGDGGSGGSGLDVDLYPYETEDNGTLGAANALPDGALGFQAELSGVNDIDSFSVFVPLGSTLRATISDGMGGCPPDANVSLQILSPANLEIASVAGLCPSLDANSDPDLNEIEQEGTYFVRITGTAAVPFYVAEIEVAPPMCGDGIEQLGEQCDDGNAVADDGCEPDCTETPNCGDGSVQTGEECDDGNTTPGDGCDDICLLEGNYCPESEPNNSVATATQITTCEGGVGQIAVIGDVDYYRVPVAVDGSSIRVEVVGLSGTGCPAGFASVARLYNANGAERGSDTDGGTGSCSLIDPVSDVFAQNLMVGDYLISIEENGGNAISGQYAVLIDVLPPGCGDGIYQPPTEECDDGNLTTGDGCDATCQLEGNYCPEIEPNDATGTATSLAGCDGGSGVISAAGDADYFSVEVTVEGSSIRAQTTGLTGSGCPTDTDTVIELYDGTGALLGENDQDGTTNCSLIDPAVNAYATNLSVGTYYLRVEDWLNNGTTLPWLLKVQVNPPACGDGVAQAGEACDDGNLMNGDGCDSACELEGNFCTEQEPNDSFTLATSLTACDGGAGQINYISDSDWYSFEVTVPGSAVHVAVTDPVGTGCPPGFNSFVRLFNSSMMQLGTDDNDGPVDCSKIDPATDSFANNLAVGTYFVGVEESGNDATSQPYIVRINVLEPGCGDGIVQLGEQCDDGNTNDADGCTNACTHLTCAPGETTFVGIASDLPKAIPDAGSTTSVINVPTMGTVTQLAVRVDVTHGWDADVDLSLQGPGGQTLELSTGNGGSSANYTNTLFTPLATVAITLGTAPFTGMFLPEGMFSALVGTSANGNWSLLASDTASIFAGTLTGYQLILCVQP